MGPELQEFTMPGRKPCAGSSSVHHGIPEEHFVREPFAILPLCLIISPNGDNMTDKKRTPSQTRWLKEHFDDVYVQEAHKRGLRSRASFKLEQLDEKDHLFRKGMKVVDLGAAPGGWSAYAASKVGDGGRVVACDLLMMDSIPGVDFIQGDFRDSEVLAKLRELIGSSRGDLVMSDMAPNMSGNLGVDQPRAMYLIELALDMCRDVLKRNGSFIVKVFNGQGSEEYLRTLRGMFRTVKSRKPDASRARSREVYYVCTGFLGSEDRSDASGDEA